MCRLVVAGTARGFFLVGVGDTAIRDHRTGARPEEDAQRVEAARRLVMVEVAQKGELLAVAIRPYWRRR